MRGVVRVGPVAGQGRGMTQTSVPAAQLPGGGTMPLLGFGTWQITGPQAYDAVRYRTGRRLPAPRHRHRVPQRGGGRPGAGRLGVPRGEVFVTTKVPPRRRRPAEDPRDSLQKLGTDHLDLWLIHWTEGDSIHEDLWQVLLEAQQAGKVRDVGVSNYSLDQVDRLTEAPVSSPPSTRSSGRRPCSTDEVARGHAKRGIVLEGYSALKNTDLDDPVLREIAEAQRRQHRAGPAALAPRPRLRRHPEVGHAGAHRRQLRDHRVLADGRGASPASTPWRRDDRPGKDAAHDLARSEPARSAATAWSSPRSASAAWA